MAHGTCAGGALPPPTAVINRPVPLSQDPDSFRMLILVARLTPAEGDPRQIPNRVACCPNFRPGSHRVDKWAVSN